KDHPAGPVEPGPRPRSADNHPTPAHGSRMESRHPKPFRPGPMPHEILCLESGSSSWIIDSHSRSDALRPVVCMVHKSQHYSGTLTCYLARHCAWYTDVPFATLGWRVISGGG